MNSRLDDIWTFDLSKLNLLGWAVLWISIILAIGAFIAVLTIYPQAPRAMRWLAVGAGVMVFFGLSTLIKISGGSLYRDS